MKHDNCRNDTFIESIETEKMGNTHAFTGISTNSGDVLLVMMQPMHAGLDLGTSFTHNMSYTQHHGSIWEVLHSGVIYCS